MRPCELGTRCRVILLERHDGARRPWASRSPIGSGSRSRPSARPSRRSLESAKRIASRCRSRGISHNGSRLETARLMYQEGSRPPRLTSRRIARGARMRDRKVPKFERFSDSRREDREFVDCLREALGLGPLYRPDKPSTYFSEGRNHWELEYGCRRICGHAQ